MIDWISKYLSIVFGPTNCFGSNSQMEHPDTSDDPTTFPRAPWGQHLCFSKGTSQQLQVGICSMSFIFPSGSTVNTSVTPLSDQILNSSNTWKINYIPIICAERQLTITCSHLELKTCCKAERKAANPPENQKNSWHFLARRITRVITMIMPSELIH